MVEPKPPKHVKNLKKIVAKEKKPTQEDLVRTYTERRNIKDAKKKLRKKHGKIPSLSIVDGGASKSFGCNVGKPGLSPCITRTRAAGKSFFVMRNMRKANKKTVIARRLSVDETRQLMGWSDTAWAKLDLSMLGENELMAALGDGFCFSVMKGILERILVSLGICPEDFKFK